MVSVRCIMLSAEKFIAIDLDMNVREEAEIATPRF